MFFVVVENIFPTIAGIEGFDVKIMSVHLFWVFLLQISTPIEL